MSISYATPATLANTSRLHSVATTEARAFGEIQLAGEIAQQIQLTIPISASATGGTYSLYVITSPDGTTWTDDIDPTDDTGDVAGKISDAVLLTVIDTTYDATNRANANVNVTIPALLYDEYIGFVLLNESGQTTPASGASGTSTAQSVT